ncbi:hypothetical protein CRX94_24080 [Salmonella enterica]|nr:hypothetical protein [Salmonella enterica]
MVGAAFALPEYININPVISIKYLLFIVIVFFILSTPFFYLLFFSFFLVNAHTVQKTKPKNAIKISLSLIKKSSLTYLPNKPTRNTIQVINMNICSNDILPILL